MKTTLLLVAGVLAGCAGDLTVAEQTADNGDKYGDEVLIGWSSADDPKLLADDLVYELAALPSQGRVDSPPWPGSYWPTFLDSINYRWAGPSSESPAAKYGRAFGVGDVEDAVSRDFGILANSDRRSCRSDQNCSRDLGEVCAIRAGESRGRCIPRWWGICHAWAPAAILEPEPRAPVTLNGVTFRVNDIKALLTLVHDRTSFDFVSLRCNDNDDAGEIRYDEYGRPTGDDEACRDTNPGTFHVLLTNYVGVRRASIIEDRVFDAQVWNQPLNGYSVLLQREVSAEVANALVGASGDTYRFNDDAVRLMQLRVRVDWVEEASANPTTDHALTEAITTYIESDTYEYLLELDSKGRIIGGEWLGDSKRDHPDFLWLPSGVAQPAVAEGKIRYDAVKQLLDLSAGDDDSPTPPAPPTPPTPPTPPDGDDPVATEHLDVSSRVDQGEARYYQLAVTGGEQIVVRTEARRDIDLFIRLDAKPTPYVYDERSIGWTGDELIRYTPPTSGVLHILVYGYESSPFTLTTQGP